MLSLDLCDFIQDRLLNVGLSIKTLHDHGVSFLNFFMRCFCRIKDDRHIAKEVVVSEGLQKSQACGRFELEFNNNQINQNILTQKFHRLLGTRYGGCPVFIAGQKSL